MQPRNTIEKKMTCFLSVLLLLFIGLSMGSSIPGAGKNTVFDFGLSRAYAQDDPAERKTDEKESPCPECPDPAKVVLNGLEDKKKAVEDARAQLKQEKKKLEKYKEELDEQLENLTKLKKQIDQDFARLEKKKSDLEIQKKAAFEAKMNKLVKTYSGMKPQNAGQIINKMDIEVARQLFKRMRENSAAQILAFVDSEKAAKISESIVFKED